MDCAVYVEIKALQCCFRVYALLFTFSGLFKTYFTTFLCPSCTPYPSVCLPMFSQFITLLEEEDTVVVSDAVDQEAKELVRSLPQCTPPIHVGTP